MRIVQVSLTTRCARIGPLWNHDFWFRVIAGFIGFKSGDLGRAPTFIAVFRAVLDRRSISKDTEPLTFDDCVMNKDVLLVRPDNKPKSFARVKPLYIALDISKRVAFVAHICPRAQTLGLLTPATVIYPRDRHTVRVHAYRHQGAITLVQHTRYAQRVKHPRTNTRFIRGFHLCLKCGRGLIQPRMTRFSVNGGDDDASSFVRRHLLHHPRRNHRNQHARLVLPCLPSPSLPSLGLPV